MTDDIRKLLGGYATGTLTDEERKHLYEAALQDQTLFEALADEQALKELLDDSTARAQLLHASESGRFGLAGSFRMWWDRPKAKVLVATGAALILAIGIRETLSHSRPVSPQNSVTTVAELRRPLPVPPAAETKTTPREPVLKVPEQSPQRAKLSKAPAPETRPIAPSEIDAAKTNPAPAADAIVLPPPPMLELQTRLNPPTLAESRRAFRAEVVTMAPPTEVSTAADAASKIAKSGEVELKYTVLLRNAQGGYAPVKPDYEFAATDRVRLQVEVNQAGTIGVAADDRQTSYVPNVTPGNPILLPTEYEFQQSLSHQIDVVFLPNPGGLATMAFAQKQEEEAKPRPRPGVASGGIANAVSRSARKSAAPAQPADTLSIRVNLRRKP